MINKFIRGMVYWVDFPQDTTITQKGRRPGIIVSNNLGNLYADNITVVPCTTNLKKKYTQPTHVYTTLYNNTPSVALCENVTTVPKTLLNGFIGVLDDHSMTNINKCIAIALNLTEIDYTEPQHILLEQEIETKPEEKLEPVKLYSTSEKKQFIKEFEKYGVDYLIKKYNITSKSSAYSRVSYYKKCLTNPTKSDNIG